MNVASLILGVALVFGLQLVFCWKAKRAAVKCIPLYLLILGFLYGAGTYVGLFGTYSFGDISGNALAGLIVLVFFAVLSLGAALAWLVYGIVSLVKRRKT